jgi:3-phosphoshikimate 1-carboxyvinyltransferase
MGFHRILTKAIVPIHHPLAAVVTVPGSKSHTNRALMLAALANGTTILQNALFSDDSRYFIAALSSLGFDINSELGDNSIVVHGLGGQIPAKSADLFIGNAGTAARFLTAFLTLGQGRYRIDGVERMRQRPIGDLVSALNDLGAYVEATFTDNIFGDQDTNTSILAPSSKQVKVAPPVTIRANHLPGGIVSLRGDLSSQYLSAVLMVAPYANQPVEISVVGPIMSKPYIDLTLGAMADFGVKVVREGYSNFYINSQMYVSPGVVPIESDASAASYFFAAPAICGGWVEVANISRKVRQGDIAFLDVLTAMGCMVIESQDAIRVIAPDLLNGVNVDMGDISDTSLTLAVIAPFAKTPTTINGIASSRVKETDRITAVCTELRKLGVRVDERPDGLTIYPCASYFPTSIHTYQDHRIAMAFSLIGLKVPGIEIDNPNCVSKTFPNYFKILDLLK